MPAAGDESCSARRQLTKGLDVVRAAKPRPSDVKALAEAVRDGWFAGYSLLRPQLPRV